MGFSEVRHLPRIPHYEEAAFRFKNIKPIRGTTCRPLGKRTAKHYAIEQRGESYVCTLYGHPVITYHKGVGDTGDTEYMTEISLCGHNTQTTRRFIRQILDAPCYQYKKNTFIDIDRRVIKKSERRYVVRGSYYLPADYTMQVRDGAVLNPVPITKKVIDREVTKQLRDKFKDSMADAEAMLRLGMARISSGDGMSDGGYDPFARHAYFRGQFLDDLTREEMTEYLWLTGSRIMHDKWQTQKLQYNMQTQKYEDVGRPNPPYRTFIVGALYQVAQLDAIEIHKEVELPAGQRA
jgi:hypothetical protein